MNNRVRLNVSFLTSLPNHDFPGAIKEVCQLLAKSDLGNGVAKTAFESLEKHLDELSSIKEREHGYPQTEEMNLLSQNRKDHILSMRGVIRYKLKSNNADERDAAKVLSKWIKEYQTILGKPANISSHSRAVEALKLKADNSEPITAALELLSLSDSLAHIVSETQEIGALLIERSVQIGENRKRTKKFRTLVYTDFTDMIEAMKSEVRFKSENAENFQALLMGIKEILDYHRLNAQLRRALAKRAENNSVAPPKALTM